MYLASPRYPRHEGQYAFGQRVRRIRPYPRPLRFFLASLDAWWRCEHPLLTTLFTYSYRIHLSPGSRRRSASATRQAMTLAMGSSGSAARRRSRNGASTPSSDAPDTPPSLGSSQQSLGDAAAALIPEPPETPPPLAEARLPIFPLGSSGSAPDQCMVSYFPASAHSQDDRGVSSSYAGQNSAGHSPSWEYRNGSTYSYPGQEHVGGSHTSYDYGDADQTTSSSGANGQSYGLGQTSFNTYPSSSAYTRGETTPLGVHSPLTFGSSTRPPLAHNSQAQPSPLSAHSPLSSQPPTPTYSSSSSISGHITPHDVDMDAGSGSPLIHRHSSDLPLSSRYSSHSTLSGAGGYSQRISSSAAEDPTIAELTLPAVNTFSVPPSPAQHRYPHSYPDSQSIQTHFGAGSRGDDSRYSAVILPPIHEDRGHSRDQRRRYTDPTYSDDYDRRDTLGSNYSLVSQTHSPVTTSSSSYSQYSSEYDRGYLVQDSGFRSNLVHSST